MWPYIGAKVEEKLTDLAPVRVLYELDGPRIFICRDVAGDLLLACQCDEQDELSRFLLVPFDDDLEFRLTTGAITIREALQQPRLWLAEVLNDWTIREIRRVKIDDVPHDNLPRQGTMLWPQLQPILSLRAIGTEIMQGAVRGRVVQETVGRADGAMRALVEYAGGQLGLAAGLIRRLCEPPANRFALKSFEVSFRAPDLGDVDEATKAQATKVYEMVGELMRRGIHLAHDDHPALPLSEGDIVRAEAILLAAKSLSPTGRSDVEEVQVSGSLVGTTELQPTRLTKTTHRNASRALAKLKREDHADAPMQFRGFIRQITDRKPYQFVLYKRETDEKIQFDVDESSEGLWVDAAEAIKLHRDVIVSGNRIPNTGRFSAIAINPVFPVGENESN
jgi:hypothetical protein